MLVSANRLTLLALAATFVLGAAIASAASRSITLREAERIALDGHAQLENARAAVASARAGVMKARAGTLPTASLSGDYTRYISLPIIQLTLPPPAGTQRIVQGDTNTYQFTLNLQQPLFTGYAGVTGVRLAETARSSAELALDQTTQTVLGGVREAYIGAVLARKTVQVQEEAVAQAESSLAQVQLRFNVGAVSGFDLLRARVQLATIRPDLVSARSNQDIADARLRLAMGLGPEESIQPADTLSLFTSRWADMPLDSLLSVAYGNRPDVRQTAYQRRAAGYQIRLAKSTYYPAVSASAGVLWRVQTPYVLPKRDDFLRSVSVGMRVSWTFWDSWKTPANVQTAQVELRQVGYATEILRDAVSLEVESARSKLHEAAATLESGQETVAQAAEALRLARVLYAEGGSTQLDVINAQVALTQARTQYAKALYDYHVAHTRMEKALGVIGSE